MNRKARLKKYLLFSNNQPVNDSPSPIAFKIRLFYSADDEQNREQKI
jgi:hypothetical protein